MTEQARGSRTNEALRQQVQELRRQVAELEERVTYLTIERDAARAAGARSEAMRQRATTRITAAIDTLMGEVG